MILYGASGHAKVIIDSIIANEGSVKFLFDDNPSIKELLSIKVYHNYNSQRGENIELVVSIGDNEIRKKIAEQVTHKFGKIIHPKAYISKLAIIEEGTVVFANSVVQTSTGIGKHVIINTRASVDHDCKISDYAHIAPGATICGGVSIGEGTFIGAGAIVLPNMKIGKWAKIGAGAVVIRDISDNETWVGNPARKIIQV